MLTNKVITINAMAVVTKGQPLAPFTYEASPCGPYDIEVKISHCGICHSDLHLIDNDWKMTHYPLIPGHEIIGYVVQKGSNVNHLSLGDRVGIGWQSSSCHKCHWCESGEDNLCLKQKATCVDHFGGFADRIIADSRFAFLIPKALKSENAAPLLCGGATVFSPLFERNINFHHKIGIVGVGGLGHLAIQFAKALGATIYVFSSSENKATEVQALGADHFISTTDPSNLKQMASSLDFIFFTSSASINWALYMNMLKPKGELIILGAPATELTLPLFSLIGGRKRISGSNIASSKEIAQMVAFAADHQIGAKVELFPMHAANEAIEKLRKNKVHYRAVLVNEE